MIEKALLLVGRTHKGSPEAAQAARDELARWRSGTADQANAVVMAERLWDSTDAAALQGAVPLPRNQAAARPSRRRALGMLGAGGVIAALAGGGRWYWQQPVQQLALATGRAQQLDRTLSDGSELSLAARTACTVTLYRDRRIVRLESGEVRFKVSHDPQRPFVVMTAWGQARVMGTTFTVSARDGRMRVAVAEGRVGVWPGASAQGQGASEANLAAQDLSAQDPAVVLEAGQVVESDARGVGTVARVPRDDVGAWRQGWMVFDNTVLPDAIARWNDYVPSAFRLRDRDLPRLRQLRVSGSFPLRDPQAFLQGLPDMLPVRVVRDAGEPITIEMR